MAAAFPECSHLVSIHCQLTLALQAFCTGSPEDGSWRLWTATGWRDWNFDLIETMAAVVPYAAVVLSLAILSVRLHYISKETCHLAGAVMLVST